MRDEMGFKNKIELQRRKIASPKKKKNKKIQQ